jgi:hypothetical protein
LYHLVPPCTTLYHLVPSGTGQCMPVHAVRTDLGLTNGSKYCLVPICGFLYGLVSTSVRTGTYHLVPLCTRVQDSRWKSSSTAKSIQRCNCVGLLLKSTMRSSSSLSTNRLQPAMAPTASNFARNVLKSREFIF